MLEGEFSDMTDGLACAGFVTAADTSVPPTHLWPDSGEAGRASVWDPVEPTVTLTGMPDPSTTDSIDFTSLGFLAENEVAKGTPLPFSGVVDPERARTQIQFTDPANFDPESTFDVFLQVEVGPAPDQTFQTTLPRFQQISGAPTGFDKVAPVGEGLIHVQPPTGPDRFFDITYQIEVVGIDETGERRPLTFSDVDMNRELGGLEFTVELQGGQVGPGTGSILQAIEISQDFRGFTSEVPQGQLGLIFTDGFESGDVSAWSIAVP